MSLRGVQAMNAFIEEKGMKVPQTKRRLLVKHKTLRFRKLTCYEFLLSKMKRGPANKEKVRKFVENNEALLPTENAKQVFNACYKNTKQTNLQTTPFVLNPPKETIYPAPSPVSPYVPPKNRAQSLDQTGHLEF